MEQRERERNAKLAENCSEYATEAETERTLKELASFKMSFISQHEIVEHFYLF